MSGKTDEGGKPSPIIYIFFFAVKNKKVSPKKTRYFKDIIKGSDTTL